MEYLPLGFEQKFKCHRIEQEFIRSFAQPNPAPTKPTGWKAATRLPVGINDAIGLSVWIRSRCFPRITRRGFYVAWCRVSVVAG